MKVYKIYIINEKAQQPTRAFDWNITALKMRKLTRNNARFKLRWKWTQGWNQQWVIIQRGINRVWTKRGIT